jgi:hypothetical protein
MEEFQGQLGKELDQINMTYIRKRPISQQFLKKLILD